MGKTLQCIALFAVNAERQNERGPHLILALEPTLWVWRNESAKWSPSLRVLHLRDGDKSVRRSQLRAHIESVLDRTQQRFEFDVLLCSLDVTRIELAALRRVSWLYLVVDEAHRLQNENGRVSRMSRCFRARHRMAISGTPLQNHWRELWALTHFLFPTAFASTEAFDAVFAAPSQLSALDIDAPKATSRVLCRRKRSALCFVECRRCKRVYTALY